MESIKVLVDLYVTGEKLGIPFLHHLYKNFNPLRSKCVTSSVAGFHVSDQNASDFRSAYHQLCDWIYGWNVSDGTEAFEGGPGQAKGGEEGKDGGNETSEQFTMKRVPRVIDLTEVVEKQEAERIIKTFETLFGMTRRLLKRRYIDMEEMLPRIGQQMHTLGSQMVGSDKNEKGGQANGAGGGGGMEEDVWAQTAVKMKMELQGKILKENEDDMEKQDGKRGVGQSLTDVAEEDDSCDDIERGANESEIGIHQASESGEMANSTSFAGESFEKADGPSQSTDGSRHDSAVVPPPISMNPTNYALGLQSAASVVDNETTEAKGPFPRLNLSKTALEFRRIGSSSGVAATKAAAAAAEVEFQKMSSVQKDIDALFKDLDTTLDYTIMCISNALVVIALSEALGDKACYAKHVSGMQALSSEFIANTMTTLWELLNRELPSDSVTMFDVRNPSALKNVMKRVAQLRVIPSQIQTLKIHHKLELLDYAFTSVDVYLFPRSVIAHRDGVKSMQFSQFDSMIWLCGGYDSAVRIYDFRSSPPVCLSQYIGHKSIVTEVHFTRNDSHIISSSFDRTIKIWNSQSASCERTLNGHLDSVTSCDVTPDSRFIASGSMDETLRIWDFGSGQCLNVIKKHTRWIKSVRFSRDGRYLLTAGLDRRIYVWDTKILTRSKTVTHTRCIEAHNDYILSIDTYDPALLLTCSRDMTVKLWDFNTGNNIHTTYLSPSWACTVAFHPDGECFATGSFDNNVLIFRTSTGEKLREMRVFNLGILCVRWPNHYDAIMVGSSDGFLQRVLL